MDVFEHADYMILLFHGRVDEVERVVEHILLHHLVQRRVAVERRSVVDLQQPRLAELVDQNVEPEDLEAHIVVQIARLAGPVVVDQVRLDRDERLDHNISELSLQVLDVQAFFLKHCENAIQISLVDHRAVSEIISNIVLIVFVDRVIGQVNKWIIEVLLLILLGGKPRQPFAKHENPEWLHIGHEDIQPQIKLVLVDEVGLLDVDLNDQVLCHVNLLESLRDEDTLALRHGFWLYYEVGVWVRVAELLQLFQLVRQQPRLGVELEVGWELLLHLVEVPCKVVFASDLVHSRKMIDFLERLHLLPVL